MGPAGLGATQCHPAGRAAPSWAIFRTDDDVVQVPHSGNDCDDWGNNPRMVGPRSCTHTGHKCPRPYTSSTAFPRVKIRPRKWNHVDRGNFQHSNGNIPRLSGWANTEQKIQSHLQCVPYFFFFFFNTQIEKTSTNLENVTRHKRWQERRRKILALIKTLQQKLQKSRSYNIQH